MVMKTIIKNILLLFVFSFFSINNVHAEIGNAIFRYSDHDKDLVLSPDDGWNPGHVGIRGPGTGIIEAVTFHATTYEEGWIEYNRVITTSSNDYAWTEWGQGTRNFPQNSSAFTDPHFDYRDAVRNDIFIYAVGELGQPFGLLWCSRLVHDAYNYAVNNFEPGTEIEADYIGRPEKVTALTSSSHSANIWTNNNNIAVSWNRAYDLGSIIEELGDLPYREFPITVYPLFVYNAPISDKGINGYSVLWDTLPTAIPDTWKDINDVTSTTSPDLIDGKDYYFHIRTQNVTSN